MKIDRTHIEDQFRCYASHYDLSDPKIRLKYDHTFRVASLCDLIAASLGIEGEDRDLAWFSGMLHDIGRFEQVRRYGTFQDGQSVNHAELSADLLFRDGMIREYAADDTEDSLLEKVVRLHNIYILPDTLTARELCYANILRDADKVDILRVNCDTPVSDIYNLPMEEFRRASISPRVYEDIMKGENVNRAHSQTAMDYLIGHIAFVFGLVYPESVRQMRSQGYLERMMQFDTENPDTREKLSHIRDYVHQYMETRISVEK